MQSYASAYTVTSMTARRSTSPKPKTLGGELLLRWLDDNGLKQLEGAALLGIAPSVVSRYITGSRCPGTHNASIIERVTRKSVPAIFWAIDRP